MKWTVLVLLIVVTAPNHSTAHDQADGPELCDGASVVGWNSAPRTSFDANGWSVIFSGKPIQCAGVVSQWMYWAKVSHSFRAVVWRPTDVTTRFTVVGINDIPAGAINEAVVYTVPKEQRIEVNEGDIIGLSYSDASPQTTWVNGGPGAAENRWYRDADPSDLRAGVTAETTGAQGRSYSFSAIVIGNKGTGEKDVHEVLAQGKALLEFLTLFPDVA